jgi:subtilisin family serine protease
VWAEAEPDFDGDIRIVVIQREGAVAERAAARLERRSLGRRGRSFEHIAGDVVKVRPERLEEVLADLEADPDVEVVAPDRKDQRVQADEVPWGVERISASPALRNAYGLGNGAGVKVAVIDTGIGRTSSGTVHPDLAAAYKCGYDFVNDDPYPWDDNGHGTHVAGILAAGENDSGVVGVAPGVRLYALKVLDARGYGYYSDFIAALDWCIKYGVRIVNYSGGGSPSLALERACSRARAAGVTIVAAAGNGGGGPLVYPAGYPSVISVGSTNEFDERSADSNTGAELDLVAPGENILSTYMGGSYVELSGTSMAAPHVAGAAALFAGRTLVTEPRSVQEYLQATAVDLGPGGRDTGYGYGRVSAVPLPAPPPTVSAPQPGEIVPSGTPYTVSWSPVPDAVSYRVLFARSASHTWTQIGGATADNWTTWLPPVVGAPLSTARLQVAAYAANGTLLSVDTRVGFVIKSIQITAPQSGASFSGGDPVQLTWDVYKTPRRVARIAVDKSSNGGRTWRRVRTFGRWARSFNWVAPYVPTSREMRLRVVLYDRCGRKISSDVVVFTIAVAYTVNAGNP